MSVQSVSASVGSMRCPISVDTGSCVKIDVPRSPRARSPTQLPKRTRYGWSSPSWARIFAMSSSVAMSPAMTAAGSPGLRYSSEKTNSATTAMTGMVASRRLSV